ncbi:hypothetical protein [Ktedonobacter racemifer]|uniref:Uncharacterized protein n=1 Tax=Ktedonobacter racemifer DSM 44963 TaxID=485913 RepID=D6U1B1_KTERA|nr:hypothetical protein [Ktedonobacter racemifer]EFH80762.1 hypothetical protein Krac_1381 [Ktedonobacter racemifer DSM 44963]
MPVIIGGEEPRLAPRSLVVRRRPRPWPGKAPAVQTARASQFAKARARRPTTTEEVPEFVREAAPEPKTSRGGSWLLPLGLGMFCALLLALVGSTAMNWSSTLIDNVRYGYPRTTQVDHIVGHELDPHVPTHFTALNLKGQVLIFEVPSGDGAQARLLQGPHLVGTGADLAAITLTFSGDVHHPDLVVTVNGLEVMFHNTGTSYTPMR